MPRAGCGRIARRGRRVASPDIQVRGIAAQRVLVDKVARVVGQVDPSCTVRTDVVALYPRATLTADVDTGDAGALVSNNVVACYQTIEGDLDAIARVRPQDAVLDNAGACCIDPTAAVVGDRTSNDRVTAVAAVDADVTVVEAAAIEHGRTVKGHKAVTAIGNSDTLLDDSAGVRHDDAVGAVVSRNARPDDTAIRGPDTIPAIVRNQKSFKSCVTNAVAEGHSVGVGARAVAAPVAHDSVDDHEVAVIVQGADAVHRTHNALERKALQVDADVIGSDHNAAFVRLTNHAAGQVIRARLGELVDARGIARRGVWPDRGPWLDLIQRLHRRPRRRARLQLSCVAAK